MAAAINYDKMMMVLALYFPHGVIMDISMLSPVAETGVGLRIGICVGGYLTPFAKRLGRSWLISTSDSGARSISADLHKFGLAPKSTVLNRSEGDFQRQIFDLDPWTYGRMTTQRWPVRARRAHRRSWAVFKHLDRWIYDSRTRSDGDGRRIRGRY